jgi:hypothetical protein
MSADEALAAVPVGLQNGLPDPLGAVGTYLAMMGEGDDTCPGPGDQLIDSQVPLSGCSSGSGYEYAGVSIYLTGGDLIPDGDPSQDAVLLGGDFSIADPAGNTLEIGGQVVWSSVVSDSGTDANADISGTLRYPGGDPWLAAGVSSVLRIQVHVPTTGEPSLALHGGLGTEGVDLWFEKLEMSEKVCPTLAPQGVLSVRDPSGAWWSLDYGTACDGCGTLSFPGQEDQPACLDLTSLIAPAAAMMVRGG